MLRKQLLTGVIEVLDAIETTGLAQALRRGASKETPARLLGALRNYSLAAAAFSTAGRKVAEVFEIQKLEDPEVWVRLMTESDESILLRNRLVFIGRELPQILDLLTQDSVFEPIETSMSETTSLQVRLIEEEGQFSTVKRVIQGLSACQELYDALASLEGEISQPLAIGAIDSGSDKAFDLFGAAKVMSELRQLIISVWDLVVFHKERKMGRQLELIASALPILERIQKMEASEKIGREQAQIIRNGIIDGTKKFLDTGIVLEEFESHSKVEPRLLLAPEGKLLAAPPTYQQQTASPTSQAHPKQNPETNFSLDEKPTKSNLSDEDIQRIAALMSKTAQDKQNAEDNNQKATKDN